LQSPADVQNTAVSKSRKTFLLNQLALVGTTKIQISAISELKTTPYFFNRRHKGAPS
jgi:hypothetical protein